MRKFLKFILCFIIIFAHLSIISYCDDYDVRENQEIDINTEITSAIAETSQEIDIPTINSRSGIVIDRNSKQILYGKNENSRKKMASTTKIMTAIIIIEHCDLSKSVEISKKSASVGGSSLHLKAGDKISILDLLYGLMLRSGNDAAIALAEECSGSIEEFSNLMNLKAKELKLNHSNFESPHGLDSENHYTTAYELAILSDYALNNPAFSKIVSTKTYTITINNRSLTISNTNELLGNFEGIYGVKTGFTNGANRCLVTACKKNNLDIICVVLGADTKKNRTQDSIKLINYVLNNFKPINVKYLAINSFENWKEENLSKIDIYKGLEENLELKISTLNYNTIPIRKDLINSVCVNINCKKELIAPLKIDTQIGTITIFLNNTNIIFPIYTSNEITKKQFYNYFFRFIKDFKFITLK